MPLHQGPLVQSMVNANHWLSSIKISRLSWYLTRVSANQASSNSAQVYKWKPANCFGKNLTKCWEVICLRLVSHPGTGSRNSSSHFTLQKPDISTGLMGLRLAQLRLGQALPLTLRWETRDNFAFLYKGLTLQGSRILRMNIFGFVNGNHNLAMISLLI